MPRAERTIDLGIHDLRGAPGDHIAYFWETDREFEAATGFLEKGILNGEHVVVFGFEDANDRVLEVLERKGVDWRALQKEERISVLGPESTGDLMLSRIGATFQKALDAGAPMIRLLGNIGWGRGGWPDEVDILRFEAKVTGAAKSFPCIAVCMYDVNYLSGSVVLKGAFGTHPLTIYQNLVRENPMCMDIEQYLERLAGRSDADVVDVG